MIKKHLPSIITALAILFVSLIIPTRMAYAEEPPKHTNPRNDNNCAFILGLTSWDCGTNIEGIDNQNELQDNIWIIASNVSINITVIAAYLVLGYVIYGGYLYIFSTGESGKVLQGKKTISQALIGMAIVLLAYTILFTIRAVLLNGNGNFDECVTSRCIDPAALISSSIGWVIGVAGIISAIFLVYGGIGYVTSSGDPNKVKKAKDTITYALIGLAVVGLAQLITSFVINLVRQSDSQSTNYTNSNQIIIAKEIHEKNN